MSTACLNTYCVQHLHQSHPLSSQGRVSGPKLYSSGSSPGQVLTPQDAGQGHRGAFPPQKEVAALPSLFPVAGLLTIPGRKLGPPGCPTPCPLLKYPQFLSSSPSCRDFSLPHSSLQPFLPAPHRPPPRSHEAAFSPLLSVHPAPACGRGGTQRAGWLEQGRNSSTHSAGRASPVGRAGL